MPDDGFSIHWQVFRWDTIDIFSQTNARGLLFAMSEHENALRAEGARDVAGTSCELVRTGGGWISDVDGIRRGDKVPREYESTEEELLPSRTCSEKADMGPLLRVRSGDKGASQTAGGAERGISSMIYYGRTYVTLASEVLINAPPVRTRLVCGGHSRIGGESTRLSMVCTVFMVLVECSTTRAAKSLVVTDDDVNAVVFYEGVRGGGDEIRGHEDDGKVLHGPALGRTSVPSKFIGEIGISALACRWIGEKIKVDYKTLATKCAFSHVLQKYRFQTYVVAGGIDKPLAVHWGRDLFPKHILRMNESGRSGRFLYIRVVRRMPCHLGNGGLPQSRSAGQQPAKTYNFRNWRHASDHTGREGEANDEAGHLANWLWDSEGLATWQAQMGAEWGNSHALPLFTSLGATGLASRIACGALSIIAGSIDYITPSLPGVELCYTKSRTSQLANIWQSVQCHFAAKSL
ncbi:hypothetical protein BU15DRAFT_64931 [Melanogaster broomeanus]|nr:hypothetical protein BU15DRAFT_64931 [Melanogaster broomeanus]